MFRLLTLAAKLAILSLIGLFLFMFTELYDNQN